MNKFEDKADLQAGLERFAARTRKEVGIKLSVSFPKNFPNAPPFIRIVYPRFQQYTGHITIGGSVCVQDLTTKGWNPDNSIGSFLVMIRNLIIDGGALVNEEWYEEYTEQEAKMAFIRVARLHGWEK